MLPPHLQSVTADMQEENDDAAKVAYMTRAAQEAGDIMMEPAPMQQDLAEAIEWAKGKTPQSIMTQRDSTLRAIRKYGAELAREGELEKWCNQSLCLPLLPVSDAALPRQMGMPDATIGYISRRVHGPLILALAKSVGYHDAEVVDLF